MKIRIILLLFLVGSTTFSQTFNSFELRYFTGDTSANGLTDFKGPDEMMDTPRRIRFLDDYTAYASRFFGDPDLDRNLVSETEIQDLLKGIKPQPLTKVRKTIRLNGWKAYGYKEGEEETKGVQLAEWQNSGGIIREGRFELNNNSMTRRTDSVTWRFKFEVGIFLTPGSKCSFILGNGNDRSVVAVLKEREIRLGSGGDTIQMSAEMKGWKALSVEGDFTEKRYNFYLDGKRLQYFIPMTDTGTNAITQLEIKSEGRVSLDDVHFFNFIPTSDVRKPYYMTVPVDENFEAKPAPDGWQKPGFDDSSWEEVDMPSAHGGLREAGESYYLRKKVYIGNEERAILETETVDPGGEIWVNGQVVAVIGNRRPVSLDITKYVKKNSDNLIAIKVNPYKSGLPTLHAPTDLNIGWFLGRTNLLLGSRCTIEEVNVHTEAIGAKAVQANQIVLQFPAEDYFTGSLEINYYPWYPEEGARVASIEKAVEVRPHIENHYDMEVEVPSPALWDCQTPNLYRVEVILKDQDGQPVDDYVTTTGIRTVSQGEGNFYMNGKPAMLNGAQIMGFRTPVETMAKYARCARWPTIAEEMLMVQKMGANLLRMHVHAVKDTTSGINDPRYAELADQMGIVLIWTTAGWIREGEAWNIDFDGYPEYMKQVYNHPAIVIWEAGNHPNHFNNTEFPIRKISSGKRTMPFTMPIRAG